MTDRTWESRCGILVDHEPHDWKLFRDRNEPVPEWFRNHHCDGRGKYARLPVQEDLLAATWPAHPLNPVEVDDAVRLGMDPDYIAAAQTDRWQGFRGLIRQEIAARKETAR